MEDAVELQGTAFLGLRIEVFWRGTEHGDVVSVRTLPCSVQSFAGRAR